MKRIRTAALLAVALLLLAGCNVRMTKPILKMIAAVSSKPIPGLFYADSCEKRLAVPYVENGDPAQVLDIYYADPAVRKGAAVIDFHGGFYVAGLKENNRDIASVFLKEGYDVVLLEYRLNDGQRDVSDELADCATGLDFLVTHAAELGLNPDRMFLTGDSAGGHLALYMAEGAEDPSLPIRPAVFSPRGVLLNCPAYDYANFANPKSFSKAALEWFIGPRYEDKEWMTAMSPRTWFASYTGPLFVSTCTNDFIRSESLKIREDSEALGRPLDFVDIASTDKKVGHDHNVLDIDLPASQEVNARMVEFMNANY